MRQRWHPVWPTLAVSLLAGAPALAAEGESPAGTPLGWVFRWLNFAVLAGAVVYVCLKKAPGFFCGRREQIASSISESARAREEAERQLREAEDRLGRLEPQLTELRAAARRDTTADAERSRAAAQQEARKIERAAQMEIEAAERAARMELKRLMAQRAVERAESIIRQRLTPESQAALLQVFVSHLGSVN